MIVNTLPIDKPLSAEVINWVVKTANEMLHEGTIVAGEPKDDGQVKMCGFARHGISGLPMLICRSRLVDGPTIKLFMFDPMSESVYETVVLLDEFKAVSYNAYRDYEAMIMGDAEAKTLRRR